MIPDNYTYVPSAALANGATITIVYADGAVSGDFAQEGHVARVFGSEYPITPTFGAASFSFPWSGPAVTAGKSVAIQLARAARDEFPDAAPDLVSATTYTLRAADKGRIKEFTNASGCTVTLPNDLDVGFNALLCQAGSGAVTLEAESGATLRQKDSATDSAGQWAELSVRVRANVGGEAAEWVASGAFA
jgi:hypothetical protein